MKMCSRNRSLSLITALLLVTSLQLHAEVIATSVENDSHIQVFTYVPDDVYRISTSVGKSTLIQLEQGEMIEGDSTGLGMGDAKAWALAVKGSNIFLKPAAEKPDTNMVIVTNRRTYAFNLTTASTVQSTAYIVKFMYPSTEQLAAIIKQKNIDKLDSKKKMEGLRAKADADYLTAVAEAQTKKTGKQVKAIIPPQKNYSYFMKGDKSLAPDMMYDDGRFTYLRYSNAKSLPAVFRKTSDKEYMVNMHIEGDAIVIHEVAPMFALRLDRQVLLLSSRDGKAEKRGTFNDAGATTKGEYRLEKGQAQ